MGIFNGPPPDATDIRIERRPGNWKRIFCAVFGHGHVPSIPKSYLGHVEQTCQFCGAIEVWDWTPGSVKS